MASLERENWTIEFSWVKAHIGIFGNELADQLAKAAANDNEAQITFNRIPISTLLSKLEEAKLKWQKEWEEGTNAALTKAFFPEVQDRQKLKSHKPSLHSDGDGPRKKHGLSPSL